MPSANGTRIFPLHLSPLDTFFLYDDRPDYPMTYASNLFFTGTFQRDALESAMLDALRLHPLLHAVVKPVKQGKPCWVKAPGNGPTIDWGSYDDPIDLEHRQVIDLTQEPGLRCWVRQSDGKSQLVLQFHHACTDGTGAHRFMGDLLAAYGQRTIAPGKRVPEPATYDSQLLRQRRLRLIEQFKDGTIKENFLMSTGYGMRIYGKRIAPLSTNGNAPSTAADTKVVPGVVSYKFSRDEHKQLREAASRKGVMLNDLLLAEIFQTMRDWNIQHGSSPRQNLRIMMPSDMRSKDDYAMSATNMTSYNFINRKMRECRDPDELIRGIRDETALIKHEQRGRAFVDMLMIAKVVPGLIPFMLLGKRCLATATVSHMGDPTRRFLATFPRQDGKLLCGDVVLEDMVGVSPLRPRTRAAISIVTLYRELALNLRFDPAVMSLDDSRQFLELLSNRLHMHRSAATVDKVLVPA